MQKVENIDETPAFAKAFIAGAKWIQSHPVNTGDGWVSVDKEL